MSNTITIACLVHLRGLGRGNRRRLEPGPKPEPVTREPGRVPRVARLLALALRIEEQVRNGELMSYSEVAVLGHVTRARVSQIMNLLNLAPDLQESILFLPRTECDRDPIILQQLQPIASILDWRKQRVLWQQLTKYTLCG
ncbi:MAG TPA: hypothetical protein VH643_15375 [Gemmataceae bacterium]|jgi:hypothetical protein